MHFNLRSFAKIGNGPEDVDKLKWNPLLSALSQKFRWDAENWGANKNFVRPTWEKEFLDWYWQYWKKQKLGFSFFNPLYKSDKSPYAQAFGKY